MMPITNKRPVAYFCAEYGLQSDLPLYAGGLGVLAGDTLKEAADQRFPMVGVGLLYRGGKAVQKITADGKQIEEDLTLDPVASGLEHVYLPQESEVVPLFVRVHLTTLDVWARVWKKTYDTVTLYLLDTDTDQNAPSERGINKALYFGSEEFIIKQQLILGIGGVKLLHALEIHPSLYHVNEGRPAFLYWQVIREIMSTSGLDYQQAAKRAQEMIVYTNHTLVRAGNQDYETHLLRQYGQYYATKMGITIDELLRPGIEETSGKFSLTKFALNTSSKASAVSQPHFELSRTLWPEFSWVSITNGVHLPTWQDPDITLNSSQPDRLWQVHCDNKQELSNYLTKRCGYGFEPQRLVMAWSRRIAGYKRLQALFDDLERLKKILFNQQYPVQLLVAGKAHANDGVAKQLLSDVIGYFSKDLAGNALYLPNYDLELGQMLTRGTDLWINTPIQGQEASGTSGMKAIANGVLQLTVPDGWTTEVDWRDLGWTLDPNHLAETFYFRLEQDIVPLFYHRNNAGVPEAWVERMQKSIELAQRYSSARMLKEYQSKLYSN